MPQASKTHQQPTSKKVPFPESCSRISSGDKDWATGSEHLLIWNGIGFLMLVVMVGTLVFPHKCFKWGKDMNQQSSKK